MKLDSKLTVLGKENMTYADRLLCLALDIGEGMLKSGGEVHRVEDTLERICHAYGAAHVEVFSITSLIMASVRMEDGSYSSQIRRLHGSVNNFSRLEDYNRISRRICNDTPDLDTVDALIKEVKHQKRFPIWLGLIGGAAAAGAFALLFGGSWRDALSGFLIGFLLYAVMSLPFRNVNILAKTVVMSLFAGILSYLSVLVGLGQDLDKIMIGTIMLLVPGLAFGNAVRDLLCGDILTGILKTVQSCLTAILIACGFAVSVLLMNGTGIAAELPAMDHHPVILLVMAATGTVGFSLQFCTRTRYLLPAAIGGALTYGVYLLILHFDADAFFLASFLSSIFAAAFSELCARVLRAPTLIFLTPCVVPIVPGGGLYYTMRALLDSSERLSEHFSKTLFITAGIAVGTMLVAIAVSSLKRKPK